MGLAQISGPSDYNNFLDSLQTNNGATYEGDKIKFGYARNEDNYDKDLQNYNIAVLNQFLSPFIGDGVFPPVSEQSTSENAIPTIFLPILDLIYPIGSIYTTTQANSEDNTKPPYPFSEFGTWRKIEGKFLVGDETNSSVFINGSTGGSPTITLRSQDIPGHTHGFKISSTVNIDHRHPIKDDTDKAKQIPYDYLAVIHGGVVNASGSKRAMWPAPSTGTQYRWLYLDDSKAPKDKYNATSHLIHQPDTDPPTKTTGNINYSGSTEINNKIETSELNCLPPYQTVYMWERTA